MIPSAFLIYADQIYYASGELNPALMIETPVTRLIEGIWDQFPDRAFHLLRCRIFTNYPLTEVCRNTIRLAAKRTGFLDPVEFNRVFNSFAYKIEVNPNNCLDMPIRFPTEDFFPASWLRTFPFTGSNRPVVAVALDLHQKPILACVNTGSVNRVHHAETKLVRQYARIHQRKLPTGSQIWVSLKPCSMCAAFIAALCEDRSATEVFYLEDDPGPKARHTLLSRMTKLELRSPHG